MKNKTVICKDINGNEEEVPTDKLSFRPSIYAVIIEDEKILLSKQWDGYDFPGGAIEFGETFEEALKRETKEETGLIVEPRELITCENSFFKLPSNGKYVQSILMYFFAKRVSGELTTKYFDETEKKYADMPEWIPVAQVKNLKFYNSADSIKIIKKAQKILA